MAAIAWFAGPEDPARRLRGALVDATAAARDGAEARGVTTGRFGEWVGASARAIRVVIAVVAAVVILLLRPLSFSDVAWTAVGALVALLLVQLLGRPRVDSVDRGEPTPPSVSAGLT